MPGTMLKADIVADLKSSLHDVASIFTAANDADFNRMVDVAAQDFGRVRPRTLLGSITLVADQDAYAAPADMLSFKASLWGNNRTAKPWDKNWTGPLPNVRMAVNAGATELHLDPPPTATQITMLGSAYKFYYFGAHLVDAVSATATTILPGDRGLLILRAQVEALREVMLRNSGKPMAMRDGLTNMTRNGTPTYIYEVLMKEFESRVQ